MFCGDEPSGQRRHEGADEESHELVTELVLVSRSALRNFRLAVSTASAVFGMSSWDGGERNAE